MNGEISCRQKILDWYVYLYPKSASITRGHLQKITLGFVQKVVAAAEIYVYIQNRQVSHFAEDHFRLCSKKGRCCWDFSGNQICYEGPKPLAAFTVGLLNLSLLTRFWKWGEQAKLLTYKGHLENGIINMHKTGWQNSKICILSLRRRRTVDIHSK